MPNRDLKTELFSALKNRIEGVDIEKLPPRFSSALEASGVSDWKQIQNLLPSESDCRDIKQVLSVLANSDADLFSQGVQREAVLVVIETFWQHEFCRTWEETDEGPPPALTFRPAQSPRRILKLTDARPRTGSELAKELDISKTAVSRHVAILRQAGLLTAEFRSGYVSLSATDLARSALRFGL